jgi:hypothetical protein
MEPNNHDGYVQIGFIWLRIAESCGLLWTGYERSYFLEYWGSLNN